MEVLDEEGIVRKFEQANNCARIVRKLGFSCAMRTTSCSMSVAIRGLPGERRSRNVHFCATSSRCQRNRVAGDTIGSSSLSALIPTSFASAPSVRRSASVNKMRRRPNRERSARFSPFRYSIWEDACRASQQAMLAISNTKKFLGFHDMLRCYDRKSRVTNLSFRTERD
jgi:hypothetical protein